ncbi:MAG TPA: GxxExxY protein [Polyangia bacterium]|nr:GxxExxY protein [Polyangia bacterium]
MVGDALSEAVIGACMEVHRHLGPGLFESVYEECLCHELELRAIGCERQVGVPVVFKGLELALAFRIDLVVEDRLILELKSVEQLLPIHFAQLRTYLRLSHFDAGLIVNFNVARLKQGIRRLETNYGFLPLTSPPPHLP